MTDLKFCPYCGEKLPHNVQPCPPRPENPILPPLESNRPIVVMYGVSPVPYTDLGGKWVTTSATGNMREPCSCCGSVMPCKCPTRTDKP